MRIKAALDAASTGLVIVAAGYLLWSLAQSRSVSTRPVSQPVSGLTIPAEKIRHIRGTGATALVEFTDYECPFCGAYARETAPLIHENFVKRGLISEVVLSFPLEEIHRHARRASVAVECAHRQGKFWDLHDGLFRSSGPLTDASIVAAGVDAGLEASEFSRCLVEGRSSEVDSDLNEGRRLGVTGTPTLFLGTREADGRVSLNSRISGAVPYSELRKWVEIHVARSAAHHAPEREFGRPAFVTTRPNVWGALREVFSLFLTEKRLL